MKYSLKDFVDKSIKKYGDKYDYSKVEYINSQTKVCIICPEHGEFWQTPNHHLFTGGGCPKCKCKFPIFCKDDFIKKAIEIHGDKYDYSKVEYVNSKTKVCIICPEHGEFWQTPYNHIFSKNECPICANKKRNLSTTKTLEEFIKKAIEIHGDKYDYSKVEYVNSKTKVCIIDKETENEFWQTPNNHLKGFGYNGRNKRNLSKDEFIKKAKEKYGDLYDYSNVEYKNLRKDVTIWCNKKDSSGNEHGFFTVNARRHLAGSSCPMCSGSSYEKIISNELHKNNIKFIYQCGKRKLNCIDNLFLDFYIEDKKIAIECQGKQHFEYSTFFHNSFTIENFKNNDIRKYKLCNDNNIKVIYFIPYDYEKYNNDFYNDKICFKNVEDLINYILCV